MLELFILANLMIGPCHGYEIKKALKGINVNNNTLYPLLRNLQTNGYVTMEVMPQENKPSRKVYSITESGKDRLIELVTDFGEAKAINNDEFYVRVAFFQFMPIEGIKTVLETRERALDNYYYSAKIMNFLDSFPDETRDIDRLHTFLDQQVKGEKRFVQSLREKYGIESRR